MIIKLDIENYKSIERASVIFGEVNVLIGKNGSGKTTLISAIDMLKKIASGISLNALNANTLMRSDFFNYNSDKTTSKITAIIQTPKKVLYRYNIEINFGDYENRPGGRYYFSKEELYKIKQINDESGELIFKRLYKNGQSIEIGNNEKIPLKIGSSSSVLSSYTQHDTVDVANAISAYSIIWKNGERNDNSKTDSIVESNNIDLDTIDGVALSLYLNDKEAFRKAIDTIMRIIPGFKAPKIRNLEAIFEFDNVENKTLDGRISTNTSYIISWSDSSYTDRWGGRLSLSGGNSRIIFLILSLYNCKAKTCFIAEEIENGIHFSRVEKLVEILRMIVKNRKIQLIVSTHSHLMLDDILPYEVLYVKLDKDGSHYTKLTETEEYTEIKNALGREPRNSDVVKSGLLFE